MADEEAGAPRRKKVAIACQGGGSQTAFTAGVLAELLRGGAHHAFDIVSLSGTSGGAICATLVWYALRRDEAEPWRRLEAFWEENTARSPAERAFNAALIETLRTVSRGHLPIFQTSPSMPLVQMATRAATAGFRPEFSDLDLLLRRHIDFEEVASWGAGPARPNLLLGAVDILRGHLRIFHSRRDVIRPEHIRASCAVPNIFPAVQVEDSFFWDGLFSDNPPIAETMQAAVVGAGNLPNEIWVVKINATQTATVPTAPEAVGDRRNELVGNVSLFQQLASIEWLNGLYAQGAFREEFVARLGISEPVRLPRSYAEDPPQPWHIPFIEMSPELLASLDYESKLDRSPAHIQRLMEDGARQARRFLELRAAQSPAQRT